MLKKVIALWQPPFLMCEKYLIYLGIVKFLGLTHSVVFYQTYSNQPTQQTKTI
jgi:hypothetical protein